MFTKFPTCLVGPYDPVTIDSEHVDWEVELVVAIGREAHKVDESAAWSHVAGVTVGQDISDRKVQNMGAPPQFSMGKSFPGFGPTGPYLVTPDELSDPDDLEISCSIDGEMVQKSRTSMMVFSVPELVARISAVCPLLPGDLIFTGTPEGVGSRARPPRFLRGGNLVTSNVTDIGEMRNLIVSSSAHGN
jgi:2-keto-4-pentenoate hydratase/2-oxohepta-3-ene-1,7-dioic acid hydratase (catechol pathway)